MALNFHATGQELTLEETAQRRFLVGGLPENEEARAGDMELSPWRPSGTPARLKAGTCTEIALNLILFDGPPAVGAVQARRLDVDSVLAAFALLHPAIASKYRERMIEVAEMGLFQSWGGDGASTVYQRLQEIFRNARNCGEDEAHTFESCFRHLPAILESEPFSADLRPDTHSLGLLQSGQIERQLIHRRFVSYLLPRRLHKGVYYKALRISPPDACLDDPALLSCRARNRLDGERVQLISVEAREGWYHDLLYPAYMWSDPVGRWRAPGFRPSARPRAWFLDHSPLSQIVNRLIEREKNEGWWNLAQEVHPFERTVGRRFPVILGFEDGRGNPSPSAIPPHELADRLCRAFGPENS
ncbi:MAG: hypothetical protein KDC10_06500 [Calditrichaeota bacterium]|nr:hypothetical protein [Candidatus Cloacimonadota bacterium]MCA9786674.1 hypothetical protein [Candidatus Cloacimonadota bacterium]MCB1046835.1 hypothetical protein [Calditrichota bacterium]MCB9474432.1 hypothetical protein [Candidatus Delongbacteria bacterium]